MSTREEKRGRGRGPNAVKGYELTQQGRLASLEGVDEDLKAQIQALKDFATQMAERVDELEGGGDTSGETPSEEMPAEETPPENV